ncbi:2-amino-3-ketobutyrate coenzyme A ligase, mitochondrial-like [Myxocyprinus asiaticus]|uniref:2-amino-3-ketobutyrate coenzyme A ligase, mitochondrial-like n=1 Tax=Myxocyprinus asiaticus TaxID=70543 RepID=UPI0022213307|nr:2-amino-3-ketobutyrate coenzyme A ligase, mitochondrial-like [Myxocyprinus asiaticus]
MRTFDWLIFLSIHNYIYPLSTSLAVSPYFSCSRLLFDSGGEMSLRTAVYRLSIPFRSVLQSCTKHTKRHYTAASQALSVLENELDSIRAAGTWKGERVITSKQGPHINLEGSKGDILNFCANNYLGLSSHPEVVQAGIDALKKYGAGLSSVRFICGTQSLHKNLEEKLAQFHEREDCILYASCFDANAGLFEVLLGPDDAVLSDELNHASIIDGIRLCRAKRFRYKHMDLNDLEERLKESQSSRLRLVVTDGVFSMDGDVAPLQGICDLAEQYGALVFIDECHATGFMGPRGRGTDELLGVMNRVHIVNSTLGKALGGAAGGYTVGPKALIDLLRQRSRPYLFSNSLPPPVVGCATRAVELLLASNEIAQSMAAKTMRFRNNMTQAGFTISGTAHPICPVMLGDARLASLMADDMLKLGVYVIGFSYPVVPKGKARIRVQISAAHTDDDIDRTVDAFIQTGRKHGVIS